MPESTKTLVAELRKMLGDYQTTEEDYYVSDEIADFDPEHMFDYFRGDLADQVHEQIKQYAVESKCFLEDLIGVGELVLAEAKATNKSFSSIWSALRNLAASTVEERSTFLKSNAGIQFDLSSQMMLAADSGGVDIEAELDFDAKVNLYEDGELVIKISSEDPSLHGSLVGYCLSGQEEDQMGVMLLRKGTLGSVSGISRLDRSKLSGSHHGNFEQLTYSDLAISDQQMLQTAIDQDADDARSIEAWKQWIESGLAETDDPGFSNLLSKLNV